MHVCADFEDSRGSQVLGRRLYLTNHLARQTHGLGLAGLLNTRGRAPARIRRSNRSLGAQNFDQKIRDIVRRHGDTGLGTWHPGQRDS